MGYSRSPSQGAKSATGLKYGKTLYLETISAKGEVKALDILIRYSADETSPSEVLGRSVTQELQ